MIKTKSTLVASLVLTAGIAIGGEAAMAYQSHMFSARQDLQAARYQLQSAIDDKAGHRVDAIKLVDEALQQTNRGIRAGAR